MVGITGERSLITKEFIKLYDDEVGYGQTTDLPLNLDAYFLCAGVLKGKCIKEMTSSDAIETLRVNYLDVIHFLERLFDANDKAKVCVIGSESAFKGSYDEVYAASKAALHLYVETKRLKYAEQHLVCVSPTVVYPSGMTNRRSDLDDTLERGKKRRLGRWLTPAEVARVAHFSLNEPSLCNTVVRMTGGNW